jgi:hypothetical protein
MTHNEAIDMYLQNGKQMRYVNIHQLGISKQDWANLDNQKVEAYTVILKSHLEHAKARATSDPFNSHGTWKTHEEDYTTEMFKSMYRCKGLEPVVISWESYRQGTYYVKVLYNGQESLVAYKNIGIHVIPVIISRNNYIDYETRKHISLGYSDINHYCGNDYRYTLSVQTNNQCYLCDSQIRYKTLEHIVPICRGGAEDLGLNNLMACRDCNKAKWGFPYSDELKYSIKYCVKTYDIDFDKSYEPNYSTWFNLEKDITIDE